MQVMEVTQNFSYKIRDVVPGTEADPSSIVYGYDNSSLHIHSDRYSNTPVDQFISDGPIILNGSGSHPFNIGGHSPSFSPSARIVLVCAHIDVTDLGRLNNLMAAIAITGSLAITRV